MLVVNRILMPTDFSDNSLQPLKYACALASKFGSQLHLLHVIPDPAMIVPDIGGLGSVGLIEQSEAELDVATRRLSELPPNGWHTDRETVRTIRTGTAFDEIIRYAKETEIDMIIMGTHGRTGLTHLLMGSVAENVVRMAPCPVLTIKPDGHQFVSA